MADAGIRRVNIPASPVVSTPAVGVPAGGDRGVLEAMRALHAAGETFALSLVARSEGSTYRKPGAIAAVAADGTRYGAISGGCLEPALVDLAQQAIAVGRARVASFDTRGEDDLVFGSGSGCRGLMRVIAYPVPSTVGTTLFEALDAAHASDVPLQLALLASDEVDPGRGLARHGEAEIELDLRNAAERDLLRKSLTATTSDDVALFHIQPAPRLLLLGAGPEVLPLVRFAQTLGWRCRVADHRVAQLDAASDAGAERVLAMRPAQALAEHADVRVDAVLAMSHLASADLAALQALAVRDIGYVGLLGPPARRDELLALLDPAQRGALRARLHAPVGLPLGGEGPEAIALAIVAELQRHFHAR